MDKIVRNLDFAYKSPFRLDILGGMVFTEENEQAFEFMEISKADDTIVLMIAEQQIVVDLLNPSKYSLFDTKLKLKLEYNSQESTIYARYQNSMKKFISIRGWGHLNGIGGLNLHPDVAKEYQDRLAEFIIEKLS